MPSAELNAGPLRRAAFRERLALFGLCSPALLLVMVIVVVPAAWLFWLSFIGQSGALSLENYQRMVDNSAYVEIFWLTIKVAFLTTAICVLAGYPLAYFLSQIPARLANICMIAVLVPFWTSLLVRTYAWLILLQRHGLINDLGMSLGLWHQPLTLVNNLGGTLVGMSHIMLPFLVLPVYGTMKAIDGDYPRAAAGLGASPVDVFLKVYFPLSLPGLFAGMLIVFIMCLGFYVTPAILGGGKIILVSMGIATNIQLFYNWGAASALGVVLFGLTLLILFGASFVMRVDQMFDRGPMQ